MDKYCKKQAQYNCLAAIIANKVSDIMKIEGFRREGSAPGPFMMSV
jgi:hypothetical protein